jgi:hypothetical protein
MCPTREPYWFRESVVGTRLLYKVQREGGGCFELNLQRLTSNWESLMLLQVTWQITLTNLLIDKDTFGVTVFPGGDYAFVIALLVIMDAIYLHDDQWWYHHYPKPSRGHSMCMCMCVSFLSVDNRDAEIVLCQLEFFPQNPGSGP